MNELLSFFLLIFQFYNKHVPQKKHEYFHIYKSGRNDYKKYHI